MENTARDKRILREKIRRKKQMQRRRKMIRLGIYAVALIVVLVFLVKGVILPLIDRIDADGGDTATVPATVAERDPNAAVRQPLKGSADTAKLGILTPGWHVDDNGTWYRNSDGTYFADGFQDIEGYTYSFDENGYLQTGWVTKGVKDYYFNID